MESITNFSPSNLENANSEQSPIDASSESSVSCKDSSSLAFTNETQPNEEVNINSNYIPVINNVGDTNHKVYNEEKSFIAVDEQSYIHCKDKVLNHEGIGDGTHCEKYNSGEPFTNSQVLSDPPILDEKSLETEANHLTSSTDINSVISEKLPSLSPVNTVNENIAENHVQGVLQPKETSDYALLQESPPSTSIQNSYENLVSNTDVPPFINEGQTVSNFTNLENDKASLQNSFIVDTSPIAHKLIVNSNFCNASDGIICNEQFRETDGNETTSGLCDNSNNENGKGEQCVMQRVIEGRLEPLDINSLGTLDSKGSALFAALTQDNGEGGEKIDPIVLPTLTAAPKTFEDNIELTNLTEPTPIDLKGETDVIPEISTPVNQIAKVECEKDSEDDQLIEGKPSLLKILPIRNGHGLWNVEELRFLLEDRGSVLLRLCAAPEAANEDILEGPEADFTAVLLDDTYEIADSISRTEPEEEISVINPSLMERLNETLYEDIPPTWKFAEPRIQSTPKRKSYYPPPPSTFFPHLQPPQAPPRGRKRGRPPLHNRAWVPKTKVAPRPLDDPIKFRPPTPPSGHINEVSSKVLGILDNVIVRSSDVDPRVTCASLSSVKKPAPGSLLSRQLMLARKAQEICNEDSVSAISDDFEDSNQTSGSKKVGKLYCPHCPLRFIKKSALTGHIKLRHKLMKKCPICNESVRIKGKYGMKFHILKAHKGEKSFKCETCGECFRLLLHLKNHQRLIHELCASSDDDNSQDSESEVADSLCPKSENPKGTNETDLSENENKMLRDSPKETSPPGKTAKKRKEFSPKLEEDDSDSKESGVNTISTRKLRSQSFGTPDNKGKESKVEDESESSESGNESDDEEDESDSEVEEKKNYFCNLCDMGFSHVFKLRHHKKKKHPKTSKSRSKAALVSEKRHEPLTCKTCNKKCRNDYQYRLHMLQHNSSSSKSFKMKTRGSTGGTVEVISRTVSTSNCLKSDKWKSKLTQRQKAGKEIKEFDNYDDSDNNLSSRGKSSIDNERPPYIVKKGRIFHCTKCNLNFKREKQMTYHLKKIHETLYPFRKCPHCPRVYRSSGPFTRHLSMHKGKRCPIDGCKAKYKILRLIKKHQRHAHPEMPHRCLRCVQLYAEESQLDDHMEQVHVDKKDEKDNNDNEEEDEEEEKDSEVTSYVVPSEQSSRYRSKNHRNKRTSVNASVPMRKSRSANISYKEDEEEEDFVPQKILPPSPVKRKPPPTPPTSTKKEALAQYKPSIEKVSPQNPLKNLREALMLQSASKAKQRQQQQQKLPPKTPPQVPLVPVPKPKRSYVRRAPYKKRKLDNSWTAALKSQYEGFSSEPLKTPKSHIPLPPQPSLASNARSLPGYSPGITADVVRRVAESLLSKHQEQQQKQQLKLQKKQMKQQKRLLSPSYISYSAKSSQLPRIAYSSYLASRENSLSSFDDSSHADHAEFYVGSPSTISKNIKVPEDEDSGPAKVIRFDSF